MLNWVCDVIDSMTKQRGKEKTHMTKKKEEEIGNKKKKKKKKGKQTNRQTKPTNKHRNETR